MQYKVVKPPVILDLYDATDAAEAVMHDFNARKKVLESIMTIIKRCGMTIDSRNSDELSNTLDISQWSPDIDTTILYLYFIELLNKTLIKLLKLIASTKLVVRGYFELHLFTVP